MTGSGDQDGMAHVELHSRVPSVELALVAWDFRPVASALGHLVVDVPAGVYQVVARAGPAIERRLVNLEAGGTFRDDNVTVRFPSAAPVNGTSTSHEYHEELAAAASRQPKIVVPGGDAGLVLMVRDVRGQNGPPLDPSELAPFRILTASISSVDDFESGWTFRPSDGAAAWSAQLQHGPYILGLFAAPTPQGAPRAFAETSVLQSVWLPAGWQTLIFVTTGERGPDLASASIHLVPLGSGWAPYQVEVDQALELAQWGLREGRAVVPDDLMSLLLGSKFQDPWLGIVAAHGLLLRPALDPSLLGTVLSNLDQLVPGHPDVAGLRGLVTERGIDLAQAPPAGIAWPPMLLASYRGLIRADARDPGVIADGSMAERVAASLSYQGIWTSWSWFDGAGGGEATAVGDARSLGEAVDGAARDTELTPERVMVELGDRPGEIRSIDVGDLAAVRVRRYLLSVADLEDPDELPERFATMSPQEIGLATSLPAASVDRALVLIGAALPPLAPPAAGPPEAGSGPPPEAISGDAPSGGAGGGGIFGGHVLLVALVAVIGLALAGAAAVAVVGPHPSPTPAATPPTTAAATPPVTASATELPTTVATPPTPAPPFLEVTPTIDFGKVDVGHRSRRQFTITNSGGSPLSVRTIDVTGAPSRTFIAQPGLCRDAPIEAGAACTAGVVFTPLEATGYRRVLEIGTRELPPVDVELLGVGIVTETPALSPSPPSATLEFESSHYFELPPETPYVIQVSGAGPDNAIPISIVNVQPVSFNDASLPPWQSPFTVDWSACKGAEIGPGSEPCPLTVTFSPPEGSELETWEFQISASDGGSYALTLSGYERIR